MNAVEKWHDIMKNPGPNISEKLDELETFNAFNFLKEK